MSSAAPRQTLRDRYGADLARLTAAINSDNDQAFLDSLDELVSLRRRELFSKLRLLTGKLQTALDRFNTDSRFAQLAEREVPDARARLGHVLKLTDEAAHRTMDLVDQSVPLAGRAGDGAAALANELAAWFEEGSLSEALPGLLEQFSTYLTTTRTEAAQLKHNLNEVVMTQTFQDLTGQIIRSVIALVLELENTLAELMTIAGTEPRPSNSSVTRRSNSGAPEDRGSYGPAVPGVTREPTVAAQTDVDDLLSGLGL